MTDNLEEARRLERLWSGDFGDQYILRNDHPFNYRKPFWDMVLERTAARSALEVGCNVGANVRWLVDALPAHQVYAVDINSTALVRIRSDFPECNAVWSLARSLPFRDRLVDLTFTTGVLIHQPDDTLLDVMVEVVRTSARWVLCGEYFAPEAEEIPYRGQRGALIKRDFGQMYIEHFPELKKVEEGFLGRETGWDDMTWWLFERS